MPTHVQPRSEPHYSTFGDESETYLPPGTLLVGGRIEIIGELARSRVSVVYRAVDHRLGGQEVAFKVVRARAEGEDTQARYLNEARLGESLAGHPHIVRSLDVGCLEGPDGFEGRMYLITELVSGQSLADLMIENPTGLPTLRACAIASDVARALLAIHERGIVHRDIKPGNVVLAHDGSREVAKVIDFGLAYSTGDGWESKSQDLTAYGDAPGTPLYMSPQQVAHERPAPAFDVYAWGSMLYELISGNPPYEGMPEVALLSHKSDPRNRPYPLARICQGTPHYIADLVDRCLHFEPLQRPTADNLIEILQRGNPDRRATVADLRVVAGIDPEATRPATVGPATNPPRGRRAWIIVAAVAVALLLVLAVGLWRAYGTLPAKPEAPQPTSVAAPPSQPTQAMPPQPEPAAEPSQPEPEPSATPPRPGPAAVPPQPGSNPIAAPPQSEPTATPSKSGTQGGARKRVPAHKTPECIQHREAAEAASAAGKWSAVVAETKKAKCWTDRDARRLLRAGALHRLGRYAECAKVAQGSSDPLVSRQGRLCAAADDSSPK